MASSKQLAGLVGPTLIVLSTSETLNLPIWATGIPPVTYLAGTLWFVAGLSIVRVHNRWMLGWPVMITLVGWFATSGGLFRMFLPDTQQGNQNTPALGVYILDVILLVIGVWLTINSEWIGR